MQEIGIIVPKERSILWNLAMHIPVLGENKQAN
jgi:hypothetical protein